jgi:hypothetical protein
VREQDPKRLLELREINDLRFGKQLISISCPPIISYDRRTNQPFVAEPLCQEIRIENTLTGTASKAFKVFR